MISERTRRLIALALEEDIGHGDVTSLSTIPVEALAGADMVARVPLVVSGLEAAVEVCRQVDAALVLAPKCAEGQHASPGDTMAVLSGLARSLLTAERTALNLVQYLCGVATLTARFVDAVAGTGAAIIDTRKTPPGVRDLAKAAVRAGGGRNHRFGLDDGILIKDNHIVAAGGIAAAVRSARASGGYLLKVEVECDTLAQVDEALAAGADVVLLDNMDNAALREAVARCRGRAATEASGGVTLQTVRAIAETGVDFISVGALTHSAPAADIGLDFHTVNESKP